MKKSPKSKTKQVLNYSAVFTLDAEGYYNVSFPAFPGCVTFGKTFKEAQKMAKEVLELWLEVLTERKEKIFTTDMSVMGNISVAAPSNARIVHA